MTKVIRWKGLIAFTGIMIVVFVFWFLLVDFFIERTIEKAGTLIVGAEVDLDKADLTINPLGLTLHRLQVTNPDSPMTNVVEIKRIAFSVDGANLLLRKVIIQEMALEGLQLGTQRTYPGSVRRKAQKSTSAPRETAGKWFRLPVDKLPDIQEILRKEDLQSLKQIQTLRNDIDTAKESWQIRLGELPDEKTFKRYKERIEDIKKKKHKDLAAGMEMAGKIAKIQEELSGDLKRIETAQHEFAKEAELLEDRVNQLPNAPLQDARRIIDKYSLSAEGLAHMSQALFGARVGGYISKALAWYEKAQPLLERRSSEKKGKEVVKPIRGKGVIVRFREYTPLPDFLIRKVNVSGQLETGDLTGTIHNITFDQDVLGKPLDFNFSGERLKGVKSVQIDGTLNHIVPAKKNDVIDVIIRGYQVSDIKISESDQLPIVLKKGSADMQLKSSVTGDSLAARLKFYLESVNLAAGKEDDANTIVRVVRSTLAEVSSFSVQADIAGTLDDYQVSLSSDLDRVLGNALGNQVRKKARDFENKLTSAIKEKVSEPMKEATGRFGALNSVGKEITSRLDLGETLLKGSKEGLPGGFKLPF